MMELLFFQFTNFISLRALLFWQFIFLVEVNWKAIAVI